MNQPLPAGSDDRTEVPAPAGIRPFDGQLRPVAAVAVGGAAGALARWGVGLALPTPHGGFPLGTFAINVVGCLLIGVLIVTITELTDAHPLLRPFLASGFLGGFTTFSAYSVEIQLLLSDGHVGVAVGYLSATLAAALAATWAGMALARAAGSRRAGPGRVAR
ncbi:fluoride efflux transporter CrcB [Pseudonocardia bannensis]|uniref:Fluoride-specific ion channel FluC n=1 Tax=Pseudonocardia bannensis TaxID=630973 RepID=A0A848DKS9_9PSEU|nr:fluoride efflux transporter CrcB [Pseudonocardia bannensis]NMH93327.1 fluoride efflux transporter CrcB [Pseudonocardia bannensis]